MGATPDFLELTPEQKRDYWASEFQVFQSCLDNGERREFWKLIEFVRSTASTAPVDEFKRMLASFRCE